MSTLEKSPVVDHGPHVWYLVFGWLGVCFGLYLGYILFCRDPFWAPVLAGMGALGSMLVTAICQDIWHKGRK